MAAAPLVALGNLMIIILHSFLGGIYLYLITMMTLIPMLARLILTGLGKLCTAIGSAVVNSWQIMFVYSFPPIVYLGIAGLLFINGPAAGLAGTLWAGINLGILSSLKFIVPNAISMAAVNYAPTLTTILPGILASITARILPQVLSDQPEAPDNADNAAAITGATTALTLAARSATFTPALAAALNAPVSLTWLAATSVITVVGMNAGQAARDYLRPQI